METPTKKAAHHLLETMMTEILARLPLRSICRFKCVCKAWKSTLESPYFRRLFVSVHKNSSSSWSLLYGQKELMGFHGCQTWDLPKSPTSFIPQSFRRYHFAEFNYRNASSGLVLIVDDYDHVFYVGNPVSQQWVKIPSSPNNGTAFGLVTRFDNDAVVLSFKVFSLASVQRSNDYLSETWNVFVYSSETGVWTSKTIHCPHRITNTSYITLNGTIYFTYLSERGRLVAYDFYSESDEFRLVHYPDLPSHITGYKGALTTCGGSIMYIRTFTQKEETTFKVWRLTNDSGDESWQLLWEMGVSTNGNYAPMTMHPFDSGILYLWSQENHHVVLCNLRTQNYSILRDGCNDNDQEFFIDESFCEKSMDELWGGSEDWDQISRWSTQFVLPKWMEPVPRPPQAEMTDTASLLSYMTSMLETRQRNRGKGNNRFWIR